MPLSKKRNRDRMRRNRLHKAISLPQTLKPVQPILDAISPSVRREGYGKASSTVIPEVDADGNPMPEVEEEL